MNSAAKKSLEMTGHPRAYCAGANSNSEAFMVPVFAASDERKARGIEALNKYFAQSLAFIGEGPASVCCFHAARPSQSSKNLRPCSASMCLVRRLFNPKRTSYGPSTSSVGMLTGKRTRAPHSRASANPLRTGIDANPKALRRQYTHDLPQLTGIYQRFGPSPKRTKTQPIFDDPAGFSCGAEGRT